MNSRSIKQIFNCREGEYQEDNANEAKKEKQYFNWVR